jgi:hypothetical protein
LGLWFRSWQALGACIWLLNLAESDRHLLEVQVQGESWRAYDKANRLTKVE